MAHEAIPVELVEIALARAEGNDFEQFAQSFLSAIEGLDFVPLGGTADGGADGFRRLELCSTSRPGVFYQFTVQENHRAKIRDTITRLHEVGRKPKQLIYATSRVLPKLDIEEDDLSEELGVRVRIRDGKYIEHNINDSAKTQAAFRNHLAHYTDFLKQVGAASVLGHSKIAIDPSVYVFLSQEVSNRLGNNDLFRTLSDGLILWALNDTDPDQGKFLIQPEIVARIFEAVPWARQFLNSQQITQRLDALSQKGGVNGREVRKYAREGKYCLPYETRQIIAGENLEDESIRLEVIRELTASSRTRLDADDATLDRVAHLVLKVVDRFFEREGLSFSYFITNSATVERPNTLVDHIEDVVAGEQIDVAEVTPIKTEVRILLTEMFYSSTQKQRLYLHALSRTYVLLFTLRAEPKIVDFFQQMTSNFRLYVGSDILIRAFTERFLDETDQPTRTLLRMAIDGGIELVLTEPVLVEVFTHLQGTNFEFINHFADIEPYVTPELARHSDKILIRAYFYAKAAKKCGTGWQAYLSQFVSFHKLVGGTGKDELRDYLTSQFHLSYLSKEDLEGLVDVAKVKRLAAKLLESEDKKNEQLAYNDALMVYGIYGLRRKGRETIQNMEFGFLTWWLTKETRIQKYTAELVREAGARYIMRPEFLLNYFLFSPTKADVVKTYKSIFPSVLGLQMGHRMREGLYHQVLDRVKEFRDMEPGRVNAHLRSLSDTLKSDDKRIYATNFKHPGKHLDDVFFRDT